MSNPSPDNRPDQKQPAPWDETLRTIIFALLLAMVFRSLLFEPFHIPSGSMKSTLLVKDYIFVSKYAYGYSRYSFPFGFPIFSGRIGEVSPPQRGDVVVFRKPTDPRIDYIKRVIGMPGDMLQVKGGLVYINGKVLPRKQIDDFIDRENPYDVHAVPRFNETLPGGKVITILEARPPFVGEGFDPNNTPIYHIPPHHYFMMGDNRNNSRDSRYIDEVGYVPEENLVGRAEFIFFSTDGTAEWANPLSWFEAMRFDRFFMRVK